MGDNRKVKIYDLTLPIKNNMLLWPGSPRVSIEVKTTVKKQGVKLSYFSFGSHTGTHIDAPSHFLEQGIDVDKIPLEKLIGTCTVLDLQSLRHPQILPSDLEGTRLKKGSKILFKTGNFVLLKKNTFPKKYISLSLAAAQFLAKKEVDLVGTDFLGIEKQGSPRHPVHKALLKKGIVIVEGLNLANVPKGDYKIVCLPLRVVGADSTPARAILIKQ